MLYNISTILVDTILLLGVIGIARSIYKYSILMDVMANYPTFGGVEVKVVRKHSLEKGSHVKGTFSKGERVIEIALNNPLEDVIDTYLHERRHSEQAFGSDIRLNEMYAQSVGLLNYLRVNGHNDHDTYFMSDHEIDAREEASRLTKEYLANR